MPDMNVCITPLFLPSQKQIKQETQKPEGLVLSFGVTVASVLDVETGPPLCHMAVVTQ